MTKSFIPGDQKPNQDRVTIETPNKLVLPSLVVNKNDKPRNVDLRSPDEKKGWVDDPDELRALKRKERKKSSVHTDQNKTEPNRD